jgi:hypothetical protein
MTQSNIRKEMTPRRLDRAEFERRFRARYQDPVFVSLQVELQAIMDAAWDAYANGRKAPRTQKAGIGFADPDYEPGPKRGHRVKARSDLDQRAIPEVERRPTGKRFKPSNCGGLKCEVAIFWSASRPS